MSGEMQHIRTVQIPIDDVIAQYKKENRRIVIDEHGLNFYEGMTADEKIAWIEQEILNIREYMKQLKKAEKELLNKSYVDYQQEFYSERYVFAKPDTSIKNIQKQCAQYVKDSIEAEAKHIKECQKEHKAEIKEYEDDIQFYKKSIDQNHSKQMELFFKEAKINPEYINKEQ